VTIINPLGYYFALENTALIWPNKLLSPAGLSLSSFSLAGLLQLITSYYKTIYDLVHIFLCWPQFQCTLFAIKLYRRNAFNLGTLSYIKSWSKVKQQNKVPDSTDKTNRWERERSRRNKVSSKLPCKCFSHLTEVPENVLFYIYTRYSQQTQSRLQTETRPQNSTKKKEKLNGNAGKTATDDDDGHCSWHGCQHCSHCRERTSSCYIHLLTLQSFQLWNFNKSLGEWKCRRW